MTRSILDVLAQAVDGDAGDLADHALGDVAGTDVSFALHLGWASLPPGLAAQLTPPGEVPADLDAGPSDVLAAVLVHPPQPVDLDVTVDERWGAGSDELDPPPADHDPTAGVDTAPAWAAHDLDDDLPSTDTHHAADHHAGDPLVSDDLDDDEWDSDDDADPWDDALL